MGIKTKQKWPFRSGIRWNHRSAAPHLWPSSQHRLNIGAAEWICHNLSEKKRQKKKRRRGWTLPQGDLGDERYTWCWWYCYCWGYRCHYHRSSKSALQQNTPKSAWVKTQLHSTVHPNFLGVDWCSLFIPSKHGMLDPSNNHPRCCSHYFQSVIRSLSPSLSASLSHRTRPLHDVFQPALQIKHPNCSQRKINNLWFSWFRMICYTPNCRISRARRV